MDISRLVENLTARNLFVTAEKKPIAYARVLSREEMRPLTFYVSCAEEDIVITTEVKGKVETTTVLCKNGGGVLLAGAHGEQYAIEASKFFQLYQVIDDVAKPRQQPRAVARVTESVLQECGLPYTFHFKAPWGEEMLFQAGDYLVRDPAATGFYRIEEEAFTKTYYIVGPEPTDAI